MASFGSDKARSQGSSSVWQAQSPYLESLYQQAQTNLAQFQPDNNIGSQAMQSWQNQINPQGNPYLQSTVDQYRQNLGQLDMQTGGQAALTGGYGGGRQGVEQALNQQNVGNQLGQFMGQQYQADMNRASTALGQGQTVLGLQPWQQQNQALGQYSGLIGAPTVLDQNSMQSSGKNFGVLSK
jgi:hypothetical protein